MPDDAAVKQPHGYWCVVCGRFLEAELTEEGYMVITHDDIDHHGMTFDDDEHPQ